MPEVVGTQVEKGHVKVSDAVGQVLQLVPFQHQSRQLLLHIPLIVTFMAREENRSSESMVRILNTFRLTQHDDNKLSLHCVTTRCRLDSASGDANGRLRREPTRFNITDSTY